MFRWFIAYKTVFRLITVAALLAVTYGVMVLIVVVSVMEGFRSDLEARIRGTTSDIRVESTIFIGLEDPARVEALLEAVPGVRSTSPVVETLALYRPIWSFRSETTENRLLLAYDLGNEPTREELDSYIRAAKASFRGDFLGRLGELLEHLPETAGETFSTEWTRAGLWKAMEPLARYIERPEDLDDYLPALVGTENLMLRFPLLPGSRFELTSFSPVPPHSPRVQKFFVAGYFKTGLYELDSTAFLLRLEDADRFLHLTDDGTIRVSAVRVDVDQEIAGDDEALIALRRRIESVLEKNDVLFAKVQTWREKKDALLQAVRMEKVLVSIILGVVILFAGFMIFIILSVQVVEKTRDIGVLLSLGSTTRGIAFIYFLMGLGLCLLGVLLGTIYGVGFAMSINTIQRWIQLLTGYELFPRDVYYLDHIPVKFNPADLLLIIVPTVAASLIASIVPALRAARKDPAVTLRYG